MMVDLVAWRGDVSQLAARLNLPESTLTTRLKTIASRRKDSRLVVQVPPANIGPILAALVRQLAAVAWWDQTVGVRESPGRNGIKSNADRSSISKDDAEAQTGISQQTVSRWRKALRDEASAAKYKETAP